MTPLEKMLSRMADLLAEESLRHRGDTQMRRNLVMAVTEFEAQKGQMDQCRHSAAERVASSEFMWCRSCGSLGEMMLHGTTVWEQPTRLE